MSLHAAIVSNTSTSIGSNLITLRSDLNGGFGEAHFFLYPYSGKWVTFFASNWSADLAFDHRFRATRIPLRRQPLFLYVRFAWNIFKLAREYLELLAQELGCVEHEQILLKRKAGSRGAGRQWSRRQRDGQQ